MKRRYSVAPLARLMHRSEYSALAALGVSGTTSKQYRADGVSRRVADRLAVNAGYHPSEVWPEITEDDIEDFSRTCDECDERFLPAMKARKDVRFCSRNCNKRFHYRHRYAAAIGERERARARAFYAENGDYVRAQKRRRYRDQREDVA